MASPPNGSTRRSFLSVVTVGVGAAIGGVVAVPAVAGAIAPAGGEATFQPVSLGPVDRFTAEAGFAPTAATYVEDPAQPAVSSGLAYVHHTGRSSRDWLASDAMFVVFSNRCTHVGCPAQVTGIGFACPCHGSQFDQQGARIAGPAVRPLDRFEWEIRPDGDLWITQRWSVLIDGAKVHYYPVKAPGQPLDGQLPWATADILYPAVTYRHGEIPAPPLAGERMTRAGRRSGPA
jgi:Rieske Fe-S protein